MAGHLDLLGRAQRIENFLAAAGGKSFQLQQLLTDINF